ncbi:hypothetical protein JANAI62_11710 [Jannaschia pagri]|uniref:N-acetyltransferase domain-containing protein n=1 Tax=Jannaschia pagri TaxID=2829797 RepID=A0ABQ4NJF1_9RHOB|nr:MULTISPECIES: GNAT family N-acetyltransferase [unclassified Jannaschia]GIT90716.1 hypothetical protein JANAI61_11740 [Jannaschia sp. AI_61]GIT94548.1 hypothetical protein JANAI62_11710 [Jannaschia sp. AI_62]
MTMPRIRRAIADDAPACAAIVRQWLDASDWMPAGPTLETLETILRQGLPQREAYVAEMENDFLGYLSLDAATAHIHGLYTGRPGLGTGKALMDRAKQGRDQLSLNTHAPNVAAHRFYAREGFTVTQRDIAGDDGIPEMRMEWHR